MEYQSSEYKFFQNPISSKIGPADISRHNIDDSYHPSPSSTLICSTASIEDEEDGRSLSLSTNLSFSYSFLESYCHYLPYSTQTTLLMLSKQIESDDTLDSNSDSEKNFVNVLSNIGSQLEDIMSLLTQKKWSSSKSSIYTTKPGLLRRASKQTLKLFRPLSMRSTSLTSSRGNHSNVSIGMLESFWSDPGSREDVYCFTAIQEIG